MSIGTIFRWLERSYGVPPQTQQGNVMGSLAAFIHYENLILCKKVLADARISDAQRHRCFCGY
jgi:hypothetical protein